MGFDIFDISIKQLVNGKLAELENYFKSDVFFYYGSFYPGLAKLFCDFIESLKLNEPKSPNNTLTIILRTFGGTQEDVEKIVVIIRKHYEFVNFVVPDVAMSAGTIFVMSGDKIYMDYASSLGPIDPQVINKQDQYVPALGYLDKLEEIYDKAKKNELTSVDFAFIKGIDLAELRKYEQARDLAKQLVQDFLIRYKFKSWTVHETHNVGVAVTNKEKEDKAKEIADKLCSNKDWFSHGRYIGIERLTNELMLKIEDYGNIPELKDLIRTYNDLVIGYIYTNKFPQFFHTRKFI
jgi:tetratricopeptide (TPR) repeat protein